MVIGGLLGLSLGSFFYVLFFWDYGYQYLSEMYDPQRAQSTKDYVSRTKDKIKLALEKMLISEDIKRLEEIGLDTSVFQQYLLKVPIISCLFGFATLLLFQVGLEKAILGGIIFIFIGLVLLRTGMTKEANNYRKEMVYTSPSLVRSLKIGILSGDPMEKALWNSIDFITGPLQSILHDMSLKVGGNKSFSEVISKFIANLDEPDILPVFQRILSYHVSGIPKPLEAFSDMDEHLERIRLDRATTMIEGVKTPLTLIIIVGILNILIQIGIPVFSYFITQMIN